MTMIPHMMLAAATRPIQQEGDFFDMSRGEAMLLAMGVLCTTAVIATFIYILHRSRKEQRPPADSSGE